MTPEELHLILATSKAIDRDPSGFAREFYATAFDLAPEARALFPTDLTEQRAKLVNELRFMVQAATAFADPDQHDAFVWRAQQLGRRHVYYGVTTAMYEPVGVGLLATLRETSAEFRAEHEQAWTKLFALIAATMLEGTASPHDDGPRSEGSRVCCPCQETVRVW